MRIPLLFLLSAMVAFPVASQTATQRDTTPGRDPTRRAGMTVSMSVSLASAPVPPRSSRRSESVESRTAPTEATMIAIATGVVTSPMTASAIPSALNATAIPMFCRIFR